MKKYQRGFARGIGDAFYQGLIAFFVIIFLAGIALGGLLFWGLPHLWDWFKPILHSWTA